MCIDVVIPCHNAADYIGPCLESVRAQSVTDWTAIVVDDASTDGSAEIIAGHVAADPRIRVIPGPGGRGAGAARNTGIAAGRSALVAFLDADDLWAATKLERQLGYLAQHPRTALLGARAHVIDAAGKVVEPHASPAPAADRRVTVEDLLFRSNPLATSSVVVRRDVLDALGGFRERYRIGEDLELWMRVARAHDVRVLEEPLIEYRIHGANTTRDRIASALQKIDIWEREIMPDPVLRERFGGRLRRRMQRMHWGAGRALARADRITDARHHLRRAVSLGAWRPTAWRAAWMLARLPSGR